MSGIRFLLHPRSPLRAHCLSCYLPGIYDSTPILPGHTEFLFRSPLGPANPQIPDIETVRPQLLVLYPRNKSHIRNTALPLTKQQHFPVCFFEFASHKIQSVLLILFGPENTFCSSIFLHFSMSYIFIALSVCIYEREKCTA